MEHNKDIEQMQVDFFDDPNTDESIEKEEIDDSLKLMEKPFDPTKINIETKTPSLDTLIKRIERKHIQMDTSTYFQRKDDLWDVEKQSRLIESILIRFPLPAFFFDASDDDSWLVVDGLQRLSSIRKFCVEKDSKKRLKLTNLEFLTHLNGKTWDELSGDLQRIIEESQVVIYKIMPGTPYDVKFNIFKRINTGGLVLQPQEIRHALFQGKPAKFIEELAREKEFLKATDNKIATHRMLDRDFANRFLCFYLLGFQNYQPDLDTFMSRAMALIKEKTVAEQDKIKSDFSKAMELSRVIFGKEAFRKMRSSNERLRPINKALFDAIATQFGLLNDEQRGKLKTNKTALKKALYEKLNNDPLFFTSISSSTGDKNRIIKRHSVIAEIINKLINN
ncbi:MAG: DUF262 domain-containing protein [Bacteroidota bacterium]